MKIKWASIGLLILSGLAASAQPKQGDSTDVSTKPGTVAEAGFSVSERGPHHRVWSRVTEEIDVKGRTHYRTNSYTELATGLNFQNEKGEWEESKETIEVLPDGKGAVASKGQHKVIFPADIYEGQIEMNLPDSSWLRSRVLGLSYFDAESGKSVLIAEVTNSVGEIHGENVVIYPSAFTDFQADLRYTYTREGFEQDVILRGGKIPLPEEFGLNPKTTRLQVLTEFFNPPVPTKTEQVVDAKSGDRISDQTLNFGGEMQMGTGKAFPQGTDAGETIPVGKQWLQIEGRDFLIEEVQATDLFPFLDKLSKPDGASLDSTSQKTRRLASLSRQLPAKRRVAKLDPKAKKKALRLASAPQLRDGFVLDYVTLNTSLTNYVFQGDTTYYFSGNVSLYGTNSTFEGGAVLKYTNNVTLTVNTPVTWQGGSYLPVALVAKDDDSVGETISGSTGNPGSTYYAANAFFFNASVASTNLVLQNIRVANASRAISINTRSGHILRNVQLVKCAFGLSLTNAEVSLRNALMDQVVTNFTGSSSTGRVEHLTVDQASRINGNIGSNLFITNSLLVRATNDTLFTSINNRTNPAISGIFTSVLAGNHYLVAGSTNRNVGTTNISATLLADLKKLTTYPPLLCSNLTFSATTNWTIQAYRDTSTNDLPDVGYHYDPLDYCASRIALSGTMTMTNGVAVAFHGTNGFTGSGTLITLGESTNRNQLARYSCVQEQSVLSDVLGSSRYMLGNPSLQLRFTDVSFMAGSSDQRALHQNQPATAQVTASQFRNARIDLIGAGGFGGATHTFTNNIFQRCTTYFGTEASGHGLSFQNNLVVGGTMTFALATTDTWTVFNNLFASVSLFSKGPYGYCGCGYAPSNSYNAYYNATVINAGVDAVGNKIITNLDFQIGALGGYYYPTTGSGLSLLINAGSTNAATLGFYQYTTQTNQVKETNSVVDIGYHYVAGSASGQPSDFDGDGIPDYIEDANGNGTVEGSETEWRIVITNQPQSQTIVAGNSVTFTVAASGQPLYYQWLFNGTNVIAGATGSSYTTNFVSVTNAGIYSVIVSNAFGAVVSSNAVLTVTCLSPGSGLVAWWQAESNALDSVNGLIGTANAGTTYTNGKVATAFNFDGTNGFVQVPDNALLRPTNFTVEAWVKFNSLDAAVSGGAHAGIQFLAMKQTPEPKDWGSFSLDKNRSSGDYFEFNVTSASGSNVWIESTHNLQAGVWYHVAGVRGANFIQLYVNGQLAGQASVFFAQEYGNFPLVLGSSGQAGFDGKLKGALDEVSLYNRALSSNEIAAIYLAGSVGRCSPSLSVSLVSPLDGEMLLSPSQPTLAARVIGPINSITNVAFYSNGSKVGNATAGTNGYYTLSWTNPPTTNCALTAVVTDNQSISITSSVVNVTISARAFIKGINLNGPAVTIEGNSWLSYTAATNAGLTLSSNVSLLVRTNVLLLPSPDTNTQSMFETMVARLRVPPTNTAISFIYSVSGYDRQMILSNVPSGYVVTNQNYRAWCVEAHTVDPSGTYPAALYYSYGTTDPRFPGRSYNKVNYILNNKGSSSLEEIQRAIWTILGYTGYETNSASYQTLTNGANLYGADFVPGPSQIVAVVVDAPTNTAMKQPFVIEVASSIKPISFTLSQTLTNGGYSIYLWLAENETAYLHSLDLKVQGVTVATNLGYLDLGRWRKYGPYTAIVTNGVMTAEVISPVKGDPLLMGLAIYTTNTVAANQPPSVTITNPISNAAFNSGVTITNIATATDPDGTVTNVQFFNWTTNLLGTATAGAGNSYLLVWSNAPVGTNNITAVAKDNGGLGTTSAPVTITVVTAPLAVEFVTPTNNQLFISSPTNILLSANNTGGPITDMLFYNGGNLIGRTNSAPYQFLWENVTNGNYTLYAIGTNSGTHGSVSTNRTIIVNAMPVITNYAPTNIQAFKLATVVLTNKAWDIDGVVTNVTFYTWSNSVKVTLGDGVANGTNYSFTWGDLTMGNHSYYAVAKDTNGAATTSPIGVFKVLSTNSSPQVAIVSPTNGAVFKAGVDLTISATATNTNGVAIVSVEFFRDNVRVAGDITAPYETVVEGLLPGTYQFEAKATDANGLVTISDKIAITVQDWQTLPANGYWDPAFQLTDWDTRYHDAYTAVRVAVKSANEVYVSNSAADSSGRVHLWQSCAWTVPAGLDGANLTLSALIIHSNTLFVAGIQATYPYHKFAGFWDGSSLSDLTFNLAGDFRSLHFYKGELLVGGYIEADSLRFGVAKFVGDGWVPVGNEIESDSFGVRAITSIGDELYIGGDFTSAGGDTNVAFIAKLVGTNWVALGSGVNGPVRSLAVWNGQLIAGGDFTEAGGDTNAVNLAKWDGVTWSAMGGNLGLLVATNAVGTPWTSHVNALAVQGNSVFVGGRFDAVQNGTDVIESSGVAHLRWSSPEQSWTWSAMDYGVQMSSGGGSPPEVTSLALRQNNSGTGYDVIVGGYFDQAGLLKSVTTARWITGDGDCTNAGPPSVYWWTPTSGEGYVDNTNMYLRAIVTPDAGADISAVDFYANGLWVGPGTNSSYFPHDYTFVWDAASGLSNGIFRLDALALDSNGLSNKASVVVSINTANTLTVQKDVFHLLVNSPATNLNVLANDVPTPTHSLRILSAGIADKLVVPGLPHTGLPSAPVGAVAGSVQVSHDQQSLIYTPYRDSAGRDLLTYTVTDGVCTNSALVTVQIHAPPSVEILNPKEGNKFLAGNNVTLTGQSFDPDGVVTNIDLFLNRTNKIGQTNNPNFAFAWTTNAPGFYTFTAVTTDNEGYTNVSAAVTITATNYSPSPHLPVAAITSPAPSVTGPFAAPNALIVRDGQLTNLIGNAYDLDAGDAVTYQLLLLDPRNQFGPPLYNVTPGALNAQGFHVGAVTNGSLGTVDLSVVENGTYLLTLIVHGGGDEATTNLLIAVDSNLKIGQFSFSEQDLVLPVNGIPLTLTRTYNSLNPRVGDFGPSWTYALNSMDVQLDEVREKHLVGSDRLPITFDAEEDASGLPLNLDVRVGGGRDVTLTLPDGRRTTFQFSYDGPHSCNGDSYGKYCYEAKWQAAPGVDYELAAMGNPVYNGLSGFWNNEQGTGFESYDFTGFILKSQDGTTFNITRDSTNSVIFDDTGEGHYISARVYGALKLTSIVQRSGDVIRISDTGVEHYANGTNLTRCMFMQRDAAGRVKAIFDPNSGVTNDATALTANALVKYIYNRDTGNLIQVHRLQDRSAGNYLVTKYHYDHPKFPHYITSIEDPRGIPLARNEYDDSGRLTAVVDADGNRTEFEHNADGKFERVIDRLGNTNTFVYDTRGNVIITTNAVGLVTTNGYDDFNNKSNEVVFLNGQPYSTSLYIYQTNLLLASINALGYSNTFTYGPRQRLEISTDARGFSTTNYYDDTTDNLIATSDALGNITSNYYSITSLLVGTRNALGTVTTNIYDPSGNLTVTATLDFSGKILSTNSFAYDANGNQTNSVTWRQASGSWKGATNTTIYDAQNCVVKTIAPDGGETLTVYNALGKQDYTVDALNRTNRFDYDAQGRLFKTIAPDGLFELSYFDAEGRRTNSVDRAQRSTLYAYDQLGRITNTIYADNTTGGRSYYDGLGRVQFSVDAMGVTNAFGYDILGRRSSVTNAYLTSVAVTNFFGYDANGNQPYVTNALGVVTTNILDALNRVTQVQFADGTKIFTGFDAVGRRVAETNQDNIVTRFGYDGAGRLIAVTNAFGVSGQQTVTRYEFDEAGNQIAQIDALNRTNLYAYDNMGRRISHTMPDPSANQVERFCYDSIGNLIRHTNFNGVVVTNQYDVLNRLTNRSSIGGYQVGYAYNVTGQRTNMMDASGTTAWLYDLRDRLTNKVVVFASGPSVTLCYGYSTNGNLTNLWSDTATGVTNFYQYDALSRLTNVLGRDSVSAGYTFDPVGNLQTVRYGSGVTNLYQYDRLNRLTNAVWKLNASALGSFYYKLGLTGMRTNLDETLGGNRTYNWQYDALYRLTNETINAANVGYGYDTVGNRTNRTSGVSGLGNQTFTFNTNDWLNSDTYDNNGNTTGSGGNTYQYDVMNRLTNVNSGTILLGYDGDGNRVSKKVGGITTYYLVDDRNPTGYAQVVEEYQGTTLTAVYTHGLDLVSQRRSGTVSYYIYDGHGSVRALTGTSGSVTDTYQYDAYGTKLNTSSGSTLNNNLYTGEQFDSDLGFYYLRARYYKPDTGRFQTMDSYEGNSQDPQSLHKYLYCFNNPVNCIDPSGFEGDVASLGGAITIGGILDGLGAFAVTRAKLWAMTKVAVVAIAISATLSGDETDKNVMRLQLQEGSSQAGGKHYWSMPLINSPAIGVTRKQVQASLYAMFTALSLKDALDDDWDAFSLSRWEANLFQAIRSMSVKLNTAGPVSGYRPRFMQEYLNPTDLNGPRIDLENIRGENLRQ